MGIGNVKEHFSFFVSTMKPLLNQAFITSKPLNSDFRGAYEV
jgi:hypothetical protein